MTDGLRTSDHQVDGEIDGHKWSALIRHYHGGKYAVEHVDVWEEDSPPRRIRSREGSDETLADAKVTAEKLARDVLR